MAFIPNTKKKLKEADNLGFGTKITAKSYRLMEKNGQYNVKTIGKKGWTLYQDLVEMNWPRFFGVVTLFFISVNGVFALMLVSCGMDCLSGVEDKGFYLNLLQAWFFSVQTLTTVGYGSVSPICISSNVVASINALTGLLTFALVTGLFFARFSKPVAQFVFSKNAIVAPYKDGTGLMFRLANRRDNQVINMEAKVVMSWVSVDSYSEKKRNFSSLELEIDKVVMLPLSWTVVHPINEKSPLYRFQKNDFADREVEVIVLIEGYDETYSQQVYANQSYSAEELLYGFKFKMMYYPGENGKTILDLGKIDDMERASGLF